MKNYLKRTTTFFLAILMLVSVPLQAFAAVKVDHKDIAGDKDKYINELTPVKVAKPEGNQTAADLIKNPKQPDIYTLRTDYKVQRGEKYAINYQPYIASVGAAATADEQKKVNQTIKLPDLAGYDKPEGQENFKIDYDTVKNAANGKGKTGNDANGFRYSDKQDFKYTAKSNSIKIKHVFQDLEDFTKYKNPDGTVGDDTALFTTQSGNTGSTMEVSPLQENDSNRKGFVPERKSIIMQVPENAKDFILEYRYNRAHYDVVFDTAGGTEIPARTLYYEQEIPKIADESIPKKAGGEFQGWMPSVEIKTKDGKTFKANEIIKDGNGKAIKNLDANLIMPAEKLTFTAEWKEKEKAGYAIQFWAERADHADNAGLEKYDYIGTRVYKDQATGSRPDLDNEPVKDIVFPDLDQARLQKIWAGEKFYGNQYPYINKFYVYNKDLTHDQNKDPKNVNLVKKVDSTGRTVYNIYYDRQVYDLYFTESNHYKGTENTFYPEIWGYDEAKDEPVKLGGPGNPYHYKARFNQLMDGWPNDAMQTKGFKPGWQSFGWGPNYGDPHWPVHLDTPPYRLNADQFLDMEHYEEWGGYVTQIDDGNGGTITAKDYTTLSFGIKQAENAMPHHMDFWMDGFKDGETIIRYDLYRFKADTNSDTYAPKYPQVQGFTAKGEFKQAEFLDSDGIDAKNAERAEVTPFPSKEYTIFGNSHPLGEMAFIGAFFNNADDWGDPIDDNYTFETNGYLKFDYKRNKYPLRFNYDPSKIKGDNEFDGTNSLQTFYEFPLKALSPDVAGNEEYKKENPANVLDNPEKLQELGLKDLVFTDTDGKLKVKRPDNISKQMEFKGWALDPAGTKLIWENPGEIMPNHAVNLYAKWGEPDYKWKVTFDPNGGNLRNIKEENLTTSRKKIQEGDIDQEEINTYAKKGENEGDKQVFTVIQRQKLVEPKKPTRKGYDFMGWEVVHYKKNAKGDYTDEIDNSYRETYKVPELYSFGNDVVAPIYLKAIWVPNERVDVKVEHYFLDKDFNKDTSISKNPDEDTLEDKRIGYQVATTGDRQDDKYILATHEELEAHKDTSDVYSIYKEYNDRVKLNNTFFQTFKVEPEKIDDGNGNLIDNPKAKDNVFKFFYKPFRTREYKVNYIDERFRGKEKEEGAAIIKQELVTNGNRHFDARNYRPIPGWKLVSDPQQQLFFDVNEKTNEFLGINGTGKDEITFYYKDVRVIEVPKDGKTPEGYVRITFKAEKGGSFGKDAQGNDITELNYDVIKGLKSQLLPVPGDPVEESKKEAGKYYITPETGKKFIKWDKAPLLNKDTIINESHTFTAYFEWSGLTASGLVRTEAFKDPNGTWTNNFAPKIEDLKKQLVWKEKDETKPLPAGTEIKLYDEAGKELTSDDQVYELVNEKKAADKDELVRTVNVKAKVTFKDGKEPQELDIPITVYKNVYEALTGTEKPLFLSQAEKGELKDITGEYVKVTVNPTGKPGEKDSKIYYVNPKAWVDIPEIKLTNEEKADLGFTNWTADQAKQNEKQEANGVYEFTKRHMFTEDTIISPGFAKDVVPQEGKDKPKVPDNFVKVIVKTTDNATDETKFEKTFWVNPTKEVAIPVTNPAGKTDQEVDIPNLGKKKVNYVFKEWQKIKTGEADDNLTEIKPAVKIDLAKNKYTDKVTVIKAVYNEKFAATPIVKPIKTEKLDTPEGKEITDEILKGKITPPSNKEIESITVVEKPDPSKPGKQEAKVTIKYKDGSSQGTKDNPVVIPVEVHKNIIPETPDGKKPSDALDNYVKVTFTAGEGGKFENTLTNQFVYYVSPEVKVDMTDSANKITKTPNVGYISGDWDTSETKKLKDTFKADTEFTFNFTKTDDVVEKTDENTKKPDGYVTVKLIPTDKATDNAEKVYFVNPKAENVTIKNKPEGKKETVSGIEYTYVFNGWTVTKGSVASWNNENINGKFIQDTEITAKYFTKVGLGELIPAPVPKKDAVTPIKEEPKPENLIENKTGLPDGTTFKYTDDGKPSVDNTGKVTAKVEVKYPNGKTVVVEVPITVVDNVVPQVGNDKPLVPDSYVKVTVDTTETATLNSKFFKVFWVKPNVEVTIPKTPAPTGKEVVEGGVTKTNKFVKWVSDDSNKEYANTIKDTFTKATNITATYEQDKNVEPVPNEGQWIPQRSNPSPKDFIKNPYDDSDPKNPNNLPPGTSLEFVGGDPDTQTPGINKTTKIKITYPNGEVKEVPVTYNVTGDVVEQPKPDDPTTKPSVPDNFVKVIVKTTDKATQDVTRLFWVNPEKVVNIQVKNPTGKEVTKPDGTIEYTWEFAGWDNNLTQQFKDKETIIKAKYVVKAPQVVPQPNVKYVITDVGVQPTKDKYLEKITSPAGKEIDKIEIINEPDVSKRGVSFATIKVTYKDGTSVTVRIDVIVQDKNMPPTPEPGYPGGSDYPSYPGGPIPMYPEVRYETIIQEKIVKVPMPVSDNYFKEVRYMQGFNGYFRPNDGLTRAEAAQILANALVEDGYKYNPNFKISYKDVGEAWYTRAVKIVTEANVFAGYDDGNFKPQAKITRNEWIATLKRFQELGDASGNNMNLSDNHWAKGEIQAAFNEGWLKIYTDGLATYKGDEFIPRQEVAAVSNKAFKRIVDKTYIGKNNLSLVTYKDVNTSMWAYEDILCASNTFLDRKDRYIAHWVKEDKNQFNIDTSDLKIVQKNFQRNPR